MNQPVTGLPSSLQSVPFSTTRPTLYSSNAASAGTKVPIIISAAFIVNDASADAVVACRSRRVKAPGSVDCPKILAVRGYAFITDRFVRQLGRRRIFGKRRFARGEQTYWGISRWKRGKRQGPECHACCHNCHPYFTLVASYDYMSFHSAYFMGTVLIYICHL